MNIIEFFTKRPLFVNLISVFILLAAAFAGFSMPRETFPPVDFEVVTIRTVYPSATAQEVEKLVTIPLEDKIFEVNGIKELTSISEENLSVIVVTLDPNVRNKTKVVNDVQRAVDEVNDLPEEAEDPIFYEANTDETPIIQVALSGQMSEKELRSYAEALEDKLIELPAISSIDKNGWRDPEIWVEVDPHKSHDFYLALTEVMDSLRERNLNLPGGTMGTEEKEYLIRTIGEFETPEEIKKVVVRANDLGNWIRVEDIAEVKDTFEDDAVINRSNGHRAINLIIVKRAGYDAIKTVEQIKEIAQDFKESIPQEDKQKIDIAYVDDMSYYVERRLNVLVNNSLIGIILVLICLILFMNWRIAALTASGLPIAFGLTLCIMLVMGISINLISMFAMIIVVGLIVDDAIIISENAFRYMEEGHSPREAATKGTLDVAIPVTVTILTTICAFFPLLLMTGIMGKFIRHIPIVVCFALTASLFEALFILPTHIAEFAKAPKKGFKESHWYTRMADAYWHLMNYVLHARYLVIAISVGVFIFAIVLAVTQMQFRLFTSDGIEQFFIRIEAPIGTGKELTEKYVKDIEKIVVETLPKTDLRDFTSRVGIIQQDQDDPFTQRGSRFAQISVYTQAPAECQYTVDEMIKMLRKKTDSVTKYKIKYTKPSPGPPVGRAVAIRIKGNQFEPIQEVADYFKGVLSEIEGVVDIEDDFTRGKDELRIIVDEEKAAQAFLTTTDIARAVNAAFAGGIATTIKTTSDEIDVRVKFPESAKPHLDSFDKLLIKNERGNLIPFRKVAHIEQHEGVASIRHLDKKRVISVLADIEENVTTPVEVNKIAAQKYNEVKDQHIENSVVFGGEQEDTEESMQSLMKAFILAAFLIFLILATTFNSLIQPLIVMLSIPFGIVGVIFTFYLHNLPLGFMNMMGMIGLCGIVVNDSIVLIDFINKMYAKGHSAREAILLACKHRLRPVILTTVTTAAGLMPTAYGWGGDDPFIKPMALTIAWGLLFGSLITLILIPNVCAILFDVKSFFNKDDDRLKMKTFTNMEV